MKTQEEIEKLAEKYAFNRWGDETLEKEAKFSYTYGYTQCQKDMANKKYTEEDMLKCWNYLMVKMTFHTPVFFKDYINSLNKQD